MSSLVSVLSSKINVCTMKECARRRGGLHCCTLHFYIALLKIPPNHVFVHIITHSLALLATQLFNTLTTRVHHFIIRARGGRFIKPFPQTLCTQSKALMPSIMPTIPFQELYCHWRALPSSVSSLFCIFLVDSRYTRYAACSRLHRTNICIPCAPIAFNKSN